MRSFRTPSSSEAEAAAHAAQLRNKYAKRGWSEAKVERAVIQATARPEPAESFVCFRADVQELLADLAEQVGDLAIVTHWYDSDVETEKFRVVHGAKILPAALREGSVCLSPDVIVSIKVRKPRH